MLTSLSYSNLVSYGGFLGRTVSVGSLSQAVRAENLSASANTGGNSSKNKSQGSKDRLDKLSQRSSLTEKYKGQAKKYRNLGSSILQSANGELTVGSQSYVGRGDDKLTVSVKGEVALGGAGNDIINASNAADTKLISHQGHDIINVSNSSNSFVSSGTGNDSISLSNFSNDGKVYAGSGDDAIALDSTVTGTRVSGGDGTDTLTLEGAQSDYTVAVNVDNTMTLTTSGGTTVTVQNDVENISFGDGTKSYNTTVGSTGATGTVTDSNETITFTNNVDTATISGDSNTINALDGNDIVTVNNNSTGNTINGDAGNDTITLTDGATQTTVNGGVGDDAVSISATAGVDNTVTGGDGTDTLTLTGNEASYTVTDNGNGTLTLSSGGNDVVTVASDVENITFDDGTQTYADVLSNAQGGGGGGQGMVIDDRELSRSGSFTTGNHTGTAGDDTVTFTDDAFHQKVYTGDGNDTFNMDGTRNYAYGEGGNDTFNMDGTELTANGGDGNDTYNIAGGGVNYVYGDGGTDTVNFTGDQADYAIEYVTNGNGTNAIKVFDKTNGGFTYIHEDVETINFNDGGSSFSALATAVNGNDAILESRNGQSPTGSSGTDYIDVGGWNADVDGGAGDDIITSHGGNNGSTIRGGDGNDRIDIGLVAKHRGDGYMMVNSSHNTNYYGDAGDDVINVSQYAQGNIHGGADTDTVNFEGDLADYSISTGSGFIELTNNATNGQVVRIYNDVENISFGDTGNYTFAAVDAMADGSAGQNQAYQNYNNTTINLTANNDNIGTFNSSNSTINAGDGNDVVAITQGDDGNTVNGGNGNDVVRVFNDVDGTTFDGGAGTDTLETVFDFSSITVTDNSGNLTISDGTNSFTITNTVENVNFVSSDGLKTYQDLADMAS